ncbi:maleylacetoacetate isomerase [Amylibacter marinus]|uniref:Maleylacetoacetate isomerase n=1 Tax=Amylibacter marinus TaxID=1475483 RepID=A0ABQ5VXP7_9RHOB|nr:maleylacetoacetate isomerase [Amylibacter marinus]GLQ35999.1 maleylacetoacetate isomerase [Amylibacter marinus]
MTVLYDYWRSSASYRLRIALGLAQMEWDTVVVDLLSAQHTEQSYLSRNPQGMVPTLEIDSEMLTQSLAIIEYLDETRTLGFLPKDPLSKARVRALSYAIAMDIHPICNLSVAKYAHQASDGAIPNPQWMGHFITKGLRAYEAMLAQGPYSYGAQITMADICLMPQIYNATRWEIDLIPMPKIRAIAERLQNIPAFAQAHPDNCPR